MSYGKTDMREVLYAEDVRIGWFLLSLLSAILGVEGAVVTIVAIKDALSGWEAVLFYAAMGTGIVVMVLVIITFTMLSISVSAAGVEFRYGVLAKRLRFDQIRSVEARRYEWLRYGGWGLRWSTGGRRAWNMPFLHTGVVIQADEGGKGREYYVTSLEPEKLARVLGEHMQQGAPTASEDGESN